MTMIFQNCCPKHPIKAFLVPNLRILIFAKMLDKSIRHIRGRWFQIWQWIFRQWIPCKQFFVLNVSIFYFCTKLCILKNLRVLISKIAIMFFIYQSKNSQLRNFFETSKVSFFLSETLCELNSIKST